MGQQRNTKTPRHGMGAELLRYLEEHTGMTVYLEDIMRDLKAERRQIQGAVYNLQARDVNGAKRNLEVVITGQAWRWSPVPVNAAGAKPAKTMTFIQIGPTKDGRLIIESEDGILYAATEL